MESGDWIRPIEKRSLSKVVMDSVRDGIISGEVKPGEFLPSESDLAMKFGVGKSSVREAMKMLEVLGYIEVSKGNGYRVCTSVNPEIINPLVFQLVLQNRNRDDLLEFRKAIEISASLLTLEKATDDDIAALRRNIDRTISHHKNNVSTLDDDIEFHHLIYASTHNPYMVIIGKAIMELFRGSLIRSNSDYPNYVIEDHEAIFDSILRKDKDSIINSINYSLSRWYLLSLS